MAINLCPHILGALLVFGSAAFECSVHFFCKKSYNPLLIIFKIFFCLKLYIFIFLILTCQNNLKIKNKLKQKNIFLKYKNKREKKNEDVLIGILKKEIRF